MNSYVNVLYNGVNHYFSILNHSDSCRISIENLFVIDVFKVHNHCYQFKAFFYLSKRIYPLLSYSTKSKLISAIQDLLKQELFYVVQ